MLATGLVVLIAAFMTPMAVDTLLRGAVRDGTVISAENEDFWSKLLVGQGEVEILRHHYLYNCTNYEDVVYRGAIPEYSEVGPFTYKEVNEYSEIEYGAEVRDPDEGWP